MSYAASDLLVNIPSINFTLMLSVGLEVLRSLLELLGVDALQDIYDTHSCGAH